MLEHAPREKGLAAVLAVALVGLLGCGEGGLAFPNPPMPDDSCTSRDTWVVRGFDYANFTDTQPDKLLTATLRVGQVVPLRVGTFWNHECDDAVQNVAWQSVHPEVADLIPTELLVADLRARLVGDTSVGAVLTLTDGGQVRAELHAVPTEGSPLLRVYTVRVVP